MHCLSVRMAHRCWWKFAGQSFTFEVKRKSALEGVMAKIRELQPAHKSDKVTVGEAARAFRKVQQIRRDENGRFTEGRVDASVDVPGKNGRRKAS
jgi:hypothetical protein